MLKKLTDSFLLLLSSGILFHRCTVVGVLCGFWVFMGLEPHESAFNRMLTLDLYLFMAAFFIFYRVAFKKIETETGDLDLTAMSVQFIGDMLWAITTMFLTVPLITLLAYSDDTNNYTQKARGAIDPRTLIKHVPRQ